MRSNILMGFLKLIDLQSNTYTYTFLLQLFSVLLKNISFRSVTPIFPVRFAPGNKAKHALRSIKISAYLLTFNPHGFLIPRHILWFFFNSELTGKRYTPSPKIIVSTVKGLVPSTSVDIESNWCNNSTWTSVQRYWILSPVASIPDAARVMLNLRTNDKNSFGSPLSSKAIKR